MFKRLFYLTAAVGVGLSKGVWPASGQEPFYKGKVVRLIVGATPGGGPGCLLQIDFRYIIEAKSSK